MGPEHQSDSDSGSADSSTSSRRFFPFLPHQLKPHLASDHRAESHAPRLETTAPPPRSASTSCSECTKAFCLGQGIDFCKDAEEDDVFTMCFQRDSNKDRIIVWGFIFGTLGLLGWAAFKRVVEWREGRAISRGDVNYVPVGR